MSNVLTCKVESNAAAILNDKAIGSIDKQLHRILTSFVLSMCDEPEMVKAIMYSGTNAIFGNESANGVPTNTGIVMLDDFLADGIAHKVFRPGITNTSWMIISALLGFVMSVIENQTYKLHNFTRLVDDFVGVIMSGLRNE